MGGVSGVQGAGNVGNQGNVGEAQQTPAQQIQDIKERIAKFEEGAQGGQGAAAARGPEVPKELAVPKDPGAVKALKTCSKSWKQLLAQLGQGGPDGAQGEGQIQAGAAESQGPINF